MDSNTSDNKFDIENKINLEQEYKNQIKILDDKIIETQNNLLCLINSKNIVIDLLTSICSHKDVNIIRNPYDKPYTRCKNCGKEF